MQILPKITLRHGEGIGVEIFIQPPYLDANEHTFITTDASSGASSLSVENGLKFAVGEFALIGHIGAEHAEIQRIHTSTTPTATTITLNGTTNHAHNRGERVTFIPYDQAIIQRSTDSGSSYSTLATIDLRADASETFYQHTAGAATDYYRVKFYNSASTNESQVSDGIIATGYVANSAGALFKEALIGLGEKIDGVITREFLFSALNEGRHEVDQMEGIEQWSFRTVFDYDAGNVIPGQYQVSVPVDLRDPDTNKNILAVRIGKDKHPLHYIDKRTMNAYYLGVASTTLNGAVADVDTSITLTSSGDFEESGSIDIAAASASGTIDNVTYTANNESTNVISGVDDIATGGHATGTLVWQGVSFGKPLEYTVFEDTITFSQPFADDYAAENIYLDYYSKITDVNSEADELDEPFFKAYLPYLRFRIKQRRNPQMNVKNDIDFIRWEDRKNEARNKEWYGQDLRINIDTPI